MGDSKIPSCKINIHFDLSVVLHDSLCNTLSFGPWNVLNHIMSNDVNMLVKTLSGELNAKV